MTKSNWMIENAVVVRTLVSRNRGYKRVDLVPLKELCEWPHGSDDLVGAIELAAGGVTLLTREQITSIDELWAYFVNALEAIARGQEADFYFPTYQLQVRLRRTKDGKLHIAAGDRQARVCPWHGFARSMLDEAVTFFEHLHSFALGDRNSLRENAGRARDVLRTLPA